MRHAAFDNQYVYSGGWRQAAGPLIPTWKPAHSSREPYVRRLLGVGEGLKPLVMEFLPPSRFWQESPVRNAVSHCIRNMISQQPAFELSHQRISLFLWAFACDAPSPAGIVSCFSLFRSSRGMS